MLKCQYCAFTVSAMTNFSEPELMLKHVQVVHPGKMVKPEYPRWLGWLVALIVIVIIVFISYVSTPVVLLDLSHLSPEQQEQVMYNRGLTLVVMLLLGVAFILWPHSKGDPKK